MQGLPIFANHPTESDVFLHTTHGVSKTPHESILKLTQSLQTTLDITSQLAIFSAELHHLVPHDGLSFTNVEGREHRLGIDADKHYAMMLKIPGKSEVLGELRLNRDIAFNLLELENIHRLAANLAYPLRNGLMYEKALLNAARDPLTGVNNRSMMEPTIQREIDLARRHCTPLTLMCADIDFFKRINDSFGHAAGDEVLRSVAAAIRRCVRSSDVIFRFGGEEFVILLTNTDQNGAQLLAERIRLSIANTDNRYMDYHISVTISLGVHTLTAKDNYNSLFNKADQALYRAKRNGRNRICIQ